VVRNCTLVDHASDLLDDIAGVLNAKDMAEWKVIGRERLAALDEEIDRLQHASRVGELAEESARPSA
jgi:hypothetical protein